MNQRTGMGLWMEVESQAPKWTKLGGKGLEFGELRWDLAESRASRRVNGCLKLLLKRSGSTLVHCSPPLKLNQGAWSSSSCLSMHSKQQCSWLFPNTWRVSRAHKWCMLALQSTVFHVVVLEARGTAIRLNWNLQRTEQIVCPYVRPSVCPSSPSCRETSSSCSNSEDVFTQLFSSGAWVLGSHI